MSLPLDRVSLRGLSNPLREGGILGLNGGLTFS